MFYKLFFVLFLLLAFVLKYINRTTSLILIMSFQLRYTEKDQRKAKQGNNDFAPAVNGNARGLSQQQEIDRLNRALDMFTYSASHDLRSPLTTMMGLINLAEIAEDEKEKAKYFSLMRKSIGKLDTLVKEIVEITMNSKLGVSKEAINFRQLLKEKQEDLFYLKEMGKVKVVLELEKEAPIFYSDKNRIRVIFSNLLSNAIKFADLSKDRPVLSIKVSITEDEAVISFADNGIGIHDKHLPNIFDMFYRAHERQVGPGLGLYIVKETVEVLNGSIRVTSVEGKGSTFEVRVPNLLNQ